MRPRDALRGWRAEILLLLALILGGILWQLTIKPIERPEKEREQAAAGLLPGDDSRAPFLLVLDPSAVARSRELPLHERDWSFAWVNWLEQELGPYRVLAPEQLKPKRVRAVMLAVISRSAWSGLGDEARAVLGEIASRNGVIVAETPPPGITLPGEERCVVLDDPLSSALVKIQQGWMSPDLPQRPRPRVPRGKIQSAELSVAAEGDALVPAADRLERDLTARVVKLLPVPRWWPFPDAASGVVAISYNEGGLGNHASWMPRFDADRKVPGTIFLVPKNLDARGAKGLRGTGVEIGLQWSRGYFDLFLKKRWGLGPLQIFRRDLSLSEQRSALAELCHPLPAATINRSCGQVWDPELGRSFRIIEQAGFEADSSFGPSGPDRTGYLFGTGMPFRPVDTNGLPFSLYEIPFLFQNTLRYDRPLQTRLIEASASGDHQLIQGLFHVDFMARVPSEERMEAWLELPGLAQEHDHRIMALGSYLGFWRARVLSPISFTWNGELLACELRAARDGLTIALPALAAQGRVASRSMLDGEELALTRFTRRDAYLLLPLKKGTHVLKMYYPGSEQP